MPDKVIRPKTERPSCRFRSCYAIPNKGLKNWGGGYGKKPIGKRKPTETTEAKKGSVVGESSDAEERSVVKEKILNLRDYDNSAESIQ